MSALMPDKPTGPTIRLSLMELALFFFNFCKIKTFEHPEDNFSKFLKKLNVTVSVDRAVIEDLIYSLSTELPSEKYDHPFGRPLNQVVLDICSRNKLSYNKQYSCFEREKKT